MCFTFVGSSLREFNASQVKYLNLHVIDSGPRAGGLAELGPGLATPVATRSKAAIFQFRGALPLVPA